MSEREPRWDRDWEIGRQGEMFCEDILKSLLSGASYETKHDLRAADTGNIYVEYECLRGGTWQPSGLQTTEAECWQFVFGGISALVVPTFVLKALSRRAWREGLRVECPRGSHPTRGVRIPLASIPKWIAEEAKQAEAAA